VDADHVGGNASVAHFLWSLRHVELVNTPFSSAVKNVEIVGSQAVLDRMGAPEGNLPVDEYC
jgi:hypothetical protein